MCEEFHSVAELNVRRLNRVNELADGAGTRIMMRRSQVPFYVRLRMPFARSVRVLFGIDFASVDDRNDDLTEGGDDEEHEHRPRCCRFRELLLRNVGNFQHLTSTARNRNKVSQAAPRKTSPYLRCPRETSVRAVGSRRGCTSGCTSFPAVLPRFLAFWRVRVQNGENAVYEVLASPLRAFMSDRVLISRHLS